MSFITRLFYRCFSWPAVDSNNGEPKASMVPTMDKRATNLSLTSEETRSPPECIKVLFQKQTGGLDTRRRYVHQRFYQELEKKKVTLSEDHRQMLEEQLTFLRGKKGTYSAKNAARTELTDSYPKEWETAQKDRRKEKKSGEGDAEDEEPSSIKQKKFVLRSGKRDFLKDNLEPIVEGLPLEAGCLVSNMPTTIMSGLLSLYGDPAIQQTILGGGPQSAADSINLSGLDAALTQAFKNQAAAGPAQAAGPSGTRSRRRNEITAAHTEKANEEVLQNMLLYEKSQQSELETAQENEITQIANEIYAKAIESPIWKNSLSLKDYQRASDNNNENQWMVLTAEKMYRAWGVTTWWLRQPRTKYYLHHWYCMHELPPGIASGSKLQPHVVVENGKNPLQMRALAIYYALLAGAIVAVTRVLVWSVTRLLLSEARTSSMTALYRVVS